MTLQKPQSLIVTLLATAIVPATAATVIYQDDFSGPSGTAINGSAPDVRPGTETWSAHSSIVFGDSGGAFIGATSGSHNASIPVTLQSGYLYELRATVAHEAVVNQTRSIQLGFFSGTPANNATLTDAAANGPVIFLRNNGSYEARVSGGTALAGFSGTLSDDVTVPHELRITLDTSSAQWVMHAYIGNVEIGTGTSFAPKSLGSVGFSVNTSNGTSASGTITNFILTSEAIPEPGSILFCLLSGVPLLTRRRR